MATSCDCAPHPHSVTSASAGPWRASARLAIGGLHCDACAARIERELLTVDGVVFARVRLALGVATVLYDPARATQRDLLGAVVRAGARSPHHYRGLVLY